MLTDRKLTWILASVLLLLIAASSQQFMQSNQVSTFETDQYRIHIVQSYPSQGSLEPLLHTQGKRNMTIRAGEDLDQVCDLLYSQTRTRHPSPCGQLP